MPGRISVEGDTATRKKIIPLWGILSLAILVLFISLAPPTLQVWQFSGKSLAQTGFEAPLFPLSAVHQADFDGNGTAEVLELAQERASITTPLQPTPLWQSPSGWSVLQAAVSDLNDDEIPEVSLLVWRAYQPWPVDRYLPHGGRTRAFQDRSGQSCHLVLVGWQAGQYREVWAGSPLAQPLRAFTAADLDGDGHQELIVLESSYNDPDFSPARAMAVWEWNGFGFSLLDRVTHTFRRFTLGTTLGGDLRILVQP